MDYAEKRILFIQRKMEKVLSLNHRSVKHSARIKIARNPR